MTDSLSRAATPVGLWLAFRGRELLLGEDGALPFGAALQALGGLPRGVQFLGDLDGQPCYGAELAHDALPPPGSGFHDFKRLYGRLPPATAALANRALELVEWDRTHRFCGVCGAPTAQPDARKVRICSNPECGHEHYPRVSPVVIVAVERGEEILLGRSPHFPPGFYSVLAGFVDAGETAEEAVHREVFEEVALRVRELRYFASQPWPFPHSLMLGYQAEYAGGELVCAADEIEDAAFFHVDRLPANLPGRFTIAHWLMRDFCRRHGRELASA
ncbi:MAG: NAD(+) diphosphatase [Thauera phenolivorans]|uniref:NAD(+) diphosphatase n=1 Tax=Thauera phenolivorans TaxID=1792543 RepID=A0A7X7R846_9RHOO|nr:NAD(+) diphosphatase [Thauera phenolivorans]NLF53998.1 NAD(+) diphosphatase [Thauera phenolivorans]